MMWCSFRPGNPLGLRAVGFLELDAVSAVFGEAAARRTLAGWRHYTWVYREVLARPEPLRAILRARGLEVAVGP